MGKARRKKWTEIIPEKNMPSLRWFYSQLLPSLILIEPPFWHPDDEQLVKDWQYLPWLHYYDDFPKGFLKLISLATGMGETILVDNDSDKVKACLELIQKLHLLESSPRLVPQMDNVTMEFTASRLLPLKLSYFVLLNSAACLIRYKVPVSDLIKAAQSGDQDAMIKLLTIDNIFLELDVIQNQMRLAALFGKSKFLKPISRAITTTDVHANIWEHSDDIFILLSWHLGFAQTGVEQFGFFLGEAGLKRYRSISSLQRKLNRYGISTK